MKETQITKELLEQAVQASNQKLKQEIIEEIRLLSNKATQAVEVTTDVELDSRLTAIEQDIQVIKENLTNLTSQMNLYFGRTQDVRY